MAAPKENPAAALTAHEARQNHPPPDDCPHSATARPFLQCTDAAECDVWPFENIGAVAAHIVERLALTLNTARKRDG